MEEPSSAQSSSPDPFGRFKNHARKLVRVPKNEGDQKEATYQRRKAKRKQRAMISVVPVFCPYHLFR
jgi:hypothetical protein